MSDETQPAPALWTSEQLFGVYASHGHLEGIYPGQGIDVARFHLTLVSTRSAQGDRALSIALGLLELEEMYGKIGKALQHARDVQQFYATKASGEA